MNQWEQDAFDLEAGGFSKEEIQLEGGRRRDELLSGGFSDQEVKDYFGVKTPDMAPMREILKTNQDKYAKDNAGPDEKPKPAQSFLEAWDAGWQMSSSVLLNKARKGEGLQPEFQLSPDADTHYRIASQAATLVGDLPAMGVGMFLGAAAGATATLPISGPMAASGAGLPAAAGVAGIGALAGSGAGAFALPTAIRKSLMEYYEKGEIQDFQDFWERTSAVMLDTTKSAVVGGATSLTGGGVGLVTKGALPVVSKLAVAGSEITAMTTMGKALEGEVPSAQDFLDAAILIAGFHTLTAAPGKLRKIFGETGVRPHEVVEEALNNPALKQELLSDGDALPEVYKPLAEAPAVEVPPEKPTAIADKVEVPKDVPPKKYGWNDFYKDYVDRLDPIKRAVKELGEGVGDLITKGDPYKLARMASDYKAKVKHIFEKGTIDFNTLEVNGKSFKDIVRPFKEDLTGLRDYLIAKRVIELEGRGIEHGFDINEANQKVAEGGAKYEAAANEIHDFQNRILKYLKDSGVLSEKSYGHILEASRNYVPFQRILEGETKGSGSAKNPVKKIKGSDLNIQDPFLSMLDNAELYTKLAERNRAVLKLVEMAEGKDGQTLITKQKGSLQPIEVKAEELQKALDDAGIDADAESFTIFRKSERELAPDEFEVWRDGKREVYKTSPELAEAIKTLDGNSAAQNIAVRMMRAITTVKRLGISLTPDFILRNFFRDKYTASVLSKTGGASVIEVFQAMGDIVGKREAYWNWLKAGGANGAFIEFGENYLKNDIYTVNEKAPFLSQVKNLITKPIHYLEAMGQIVEQSTRLAEAKRVMKGATSGEKIFDAGFTSREVTLDFQRMGAKVTALNQIIAFMNAGIQGLDRTARAIKEDPAAIAKKGAMYITAPSMLLWWANRDDERVKQLPQWERDTHWIIATDKWESEGVPNEGDALPDYLVRIGKDGRREINRGTIWRLPKPQEMGMLFGTLPERLLEAYVGHNPDAFREMGKTLQSILSPNLIPDALSPMAEQFFNKSLFTENKIVPGHLEGMLPELQYTNYTTNASRALGRLIQAVPGLNSMGPEGVTLSSPMVIENYVRSWSGTTGMYALQTVDYFLEKSGITDDPVKPSITIADIPFVKAFVARFPTANADSIQKFQEHFEQNKRVLDSFKELAKRGSVEDAEALYRNEQYQRNFMDLSGIHDAINNQGQFIQKVYRLKDIPPVEKRQIIDSAYYQMIETAKAGLKAVQDFEKNLKEEKGN